MTDDNQQLVESATAEDNSKKYNAIAFGVDGNHFIIARTGEHWAITEDKTPREWHVGAQAFDAFLRDHSSLYDTPLTQLIDDIPYNAAGLDDLEAIISSHATVRFAHVTHVPEASEHQEKIDEEAPLPPGIHGNIKADMNFWGLAAASMRHVQNLIDSVANLGSHALAKVSGQEDVTARDLYNLSLAQIYTTDELSQLGEIVEGEFASAIKNYACNHDDKILMPTGITENVPFSVDDVSGTFAMDDHGHIHQWNKGRWDTLKTTDMPQFFGLSEKAIDAQDKTAPTYEGNTTRIHKASVYGSLASSYVVGNMLPVKPVSNVMKIAAIAGVAAQIISDLFSEDKQKSIFEKAADFFESRMKDGAQASQNTQALQTDNGTAIA